MNIIMVSFSLVKHEKQVEMDKLRKYGQFQWKFKDKLDWLYPPADWLNPSADWLNPPAIKTVRQHIMLVHLVLIFFLIILFSQLFAFCQQRELYLHNQRTKLLILRSYVDYLNYPFKQALLPVLLYYHTWVTPEAALYIFYFFFFTYNQLTD